MTKLIEKQMAIELRNMGFSYNEIRTELKVSKSTLSLWLRSIGLVRFHAKRLIEKQRASQQKAVEKWHKFRVDRTLQIKQAAAADVGSLSARERWLMGVALYWAEGTKEHQKVVPVIFSNSDPDMVSFFRQWIIDFLGVTSGDLKFELFIHQQSKQIDHAIKFWTSLLNIHQSQLVVRFKRHNPSPKRKNINAYYVGLIKIIVRRSTDLNRKIDGWIDGIVKR